MSTMNKNEEDSTRRPVFRYNNPFLIIIHQLLSSQYRHHHHRSHPCGLGGGGPICISRVSVFFRFLLFLLLLITQEDCLAFMDTTLNNATLPDSSNRDRNNPYLLDENSVVLITGIAGVLGSELALALHHTYQIQAILGIDSFVGGTLPTSYGWAGDGATKPKQPTFVQFLLEKDPFLVSSSSKNDKIHEISNLEMKIKKKLILKAKREFQILDLQRQRVSRLVQTLGRKLFLYKADVRVSLPEYFDLGQIPILDTIFTTHHHERKQQEENEEENENENEKPNTEEEEEEEEDITRVWRGITHIVHLADDKMTQLDGKDLDELVRDSINIFNRTSTLEELYDTIIIPRGKEDIRAGIMETIMEQLVKAQRQYRKKSTTTASSIFHTDNTTTSSDSRVYPLVPHLVYASSYEVYNYLDEKISMSDVSSSSTTTSSFKEDPTFVLQDKNIGIMKEDTPITTPSSMRGAAKVLDEMIAQLYYTHHDIFSIGLRFFPIYGPWCNPDDRIPLVDMAQRAVGILDGHDIGSSSNVPILPIKPKDEKDKKHIVVPVISSIKPFQHVRDYVYIDDAIDAILAAMQYYPTTSSSTTTSSSVSTNKTNPSPLVVNVGSGTGSSLASIGEYMENYFPRSDEKASISSILSREKLNQEFKDESTTGKSLTVAIASTEVAQKLLGFKTRTSLKDGVLQLLSWHYDRISYIRRHANADLSAIVPSLSFPNESTIFQQVTDEKTQAIIKSGMHACSLLDEECLRGHTVFPCASECSDDRFCTPSLYDHVAFISRVLTSQCPTILYSVSWDRNLQNILSAVMSTSPDSVPYVDPLETMSLELKGVYRKDSKDTTMKLLRNSVGYSCNVAFVPEDSLLVQRIKQERGISNFVNIGQELVTTLTRYQQESTTTKRDEELKKIDKVLLKKIDQVLLRHGFWTLIPLSIPDEYYSDSFDENALFYNALKLLPKLSPGYFFSSSANRHAIYCDTNVLLHNADALVDLLYKPQTSEERIQRLNPSKTILVVPGAKRPRIRSSDYNLKHEMPSSLLEIINSENLVSQDRLYTMIRSATRGILFGSGSTDAVVDSKWMVHLLEHGQNDDALRLRCDVYEEVSLWNLSTDRQALEFILGFHDLRNKLQYILEERMIWWKTKLSKSMILSETFASHTLSEVDVMDSFLMSVSSMKKKDEQSFVRIIPSSYYDIVIIKDY